MHMNLQNKCYYDLLCLVFIGVGIHFYQPSISVFSSVYPIKAYKGVAVYTSCYRARGGLHPGHLSVGW